MPTIIPKHTLQDDCADYESELAIVIGKTCKNVSEADALKYVLGYTAANFHNTETGATIAVFFNLSDYRPKAHPADQLFRRLAATIEDEK